MATRSVGSRPTLRATTQSTNSNMFLTAFSTNLLTSVSISSLGESAHFSQTEVSGTATSKSCRLAHPNGRDFYDLRARVNGIHPFSDGVERERLLGKAFD